jgi:hypothetical protein
MGRERRMKDGRREKNEEGRMKDGRRGEGRMMDGRRRKNDGWEEREE